MKIEPEVEETKEEELPLDVSFSEQDAIIAQFAEEISEKSEVKLKTLQDVEPD